MPRSKRQRATRRSKASRALRACQAPSEFDYIEDVAHIDLRIFHDVIVPLLEQPPCRADITRDDLYTVQLANYNRPRPFFSLLV